MFYFFLCLFSNHRPTCYLDIFGMLGNTLTKIQFLVLIYLQVNPTRIKISLAEQTRRLETKQMPRYWPPVQCS